MQKNEPLGNGDEGVRKPAKTKTLFGLIIQTLCLVCDCFHFLHGPRKPYSWAGALLDLNIYFTFCIRAHLPLPGRWLQIFKGQIQKMLVRI